MDHSKIDMHCHIIPDFYRMVLGKTGHSNVDGMPGIPYWNAESHLKTMADLSITKSIISFSSPGMLPDPIDSNMTVDLVRQCNNFAGDLKKAYPDKFGWWAPIPLPNVPASLDEITYALDTLGADGIGLLTNFNGHYLGDKIFNPVWAELNRRRATVFIHPTAGCMKDLHTHFPSRPVEALPYGDHYPSPMFEFLFDSARAVINLFLSGTVTNYPHVKYIVSHCGAVLPPLLERITKFNEILGLPPGLTSENIKADFAKQFFFDMAGFPFPDQIHGLLRCVEPSRLVYGSDYPFTPGEVAGGLITDMDEGMTGLWGDDEKGEKIKKGVWEANAHKLLHQKVKAKL